MNTKECTGCGKIKSLGRFYRDKRSKDGRGWFCKLCVKKYKQSKQGKISQRKSGIKWRNSKKGKEYYYQNTFGISLEQYDEMFEEQGGVCAVCGEIDDYGHRLCVDHDHEIGKVRGLLCHKCNTLIGNAKENIIILKSAINYLLLEKK